MDQQLFNLKVGRSGSVLRREQIELFVARNQAAGKDGQESRERRKGSQDQMQEGLLISPCLPSTCASAFLLLGHGKGQL